MPAPSNERPTPSAHPGRAPAIAAIVCLLMATLMLVTGITIGGLSPEFWLFCVLALIFSGLWWSRRKV